MSQFTTPISARQINTPISRSHHYDELEMAMSRVNQAMIEAMLQDLADMHQYGTPFFGSRTVVERFTKLNGLAVLKRNDSGLSDKIMAVILASWQGLASERGLAFLQFVLNMLYPGQNKIVQLWHSKLRSSAYPTYLYENKVPDSFLTSRVRIKLDNQINITELTELAPVFRRLVPWHIVPEVSINVDIDDKKIGMALAGVFFQVADFSP